VVKNWEVLRRETVGDFGLFKVEAKQARSPRTGSTLPVKAIDFPDWSMILPVTPEGEAVMVRQYRHGIERVCLELPGGLVDPEDDSPEQAAGRELIEETGYEAQDIALLGKCYPQPAVLSNAGFFYLAEGVRRVKAPDLDPGEDIEIVRVALNRIPAMIADGRIDHAMVVVAFCYYWQRQPAARQN
jgi:8-oxo-dGTP pyrophosphatase MutT (NUDIX family)